MERPFLEPELSHPKKPRASKPKVKSGCITCKTRRVKCDETKPNCLRCANFGRKCAGYASKEDTPPADIIPTTRRRLASKAAATEPPSEESPSIDACFALLSPPPAAPHFAPSIPPGITFQDEAELQYLCHFRDVTAIELSGGFSPTMWNSVILQACDNPEIRRLTIATAAMSMAVAPTPYLNTASDFHRQYALQQYGEALKAIHRQIVLSYSDSVKTTMISALLIFCFESLQGDVTPTMTHIQSALEILVKKLTNEPHTYQFPAAGYLGSLVHSPINDELLMAFMRIDRPSLSLLCRKKGQPPRPAGRVFSLIFPPEQLEIPNTFATIEEGRILLDDIRWRMLPGPQVPESMSTLWQNNKGEDLSPDVGAVPWHVQEWYQSYETPKDSAILSQRLVLWHDAFSPLLNFAMTPAGEPMFIAAAMLHIQAMAAELVLTGFFTPSFSKQRSSSFSNFHSSPFTELEPVTRIVSGGALSVPPSMPSRGRSASHSSPQPTQENMKLFPTVHAILDFSRRLVAHPRFSKGFVFDTGIISSLSLVVMLCPDRGLRREAVEVLKAMRPRREGVWDSRVCAEAGEKSIAKEESEMELIDPSLR